VATSDRPIPITKEGLARFKERLDYLINVRRPQVARRIQEARELAGSEASGEYEDAKNEQAMVEGEIRQLEHLIQNAIIIEEHHDSQVVELGSTVTLMDEEGRVVRYTIVGSAEADPKQGRISNESPVGRALLGRRVGEVVEVQAPAGIKRWTVVSLG
jgi:transcription elongation factor GreA